MLLQSIHFRIFNGDGYDLDKLLLLKYFNNYSIIQWLKTIKLLKKTLNIRINFNSLSFFNKFLNNNLNIFFKTILKTIPKQNLKLFYKKVLNFVLVRYFKKYLKKIFCLSEFFIENLNYMGSKNHNFYDLKGFYSNKFLNINFLPLRFKLSNANLKKSFYKEEFLKPIKNIFNKIENLNNKSIFITGEVFDFYKGSITPFYKSKFSWFASTGLKSDVECNNIEVDSIIRTKPLNYLYEDPYKDIVFKLRNFKSQIKTQVKKKSRHLFFYRLHNFYGFQRFISESNTSFNFKQNHNFLVNNQYVFFFLFSSLKFKKIFFTKFNLLQFKNDIIFKFSYSKTSTLELRKLMFFLFQSIKKNFWYYNFINEDLKVIVRSTEVTYRSLVSFINLQKYFFNVILHLIKNFFGKILSSNFILRKLNLNILKKSNYLNLLYFFGNLYLLYKMFLVKIYNYINRHELLKIFFEIFLDNKKRLILKKKLYLELTLAEQTSIHIKLFNKTRWFNMYKQFFFYIYFFLDFKFNIENLLLPQENRGYFYKELNENLLNSFMDLQIKWHFAGYLHLKDFYFFFLEFLEILCLTCKQYYYFGQKVLNKFKDINKRYILSTIYIFLFNKNKIDLINESILISNIANFSSFFLGKWFYYRQIHHFADNLNDSFYNELKPYHQLGFNLLESNLYQLNRLNLDYVNLNLDNYFKLNLLRKKNLLNINTNNSNLTKFGSSSFIFKKLYKLRNFFWSSNLVKIVDNSLKSLVNFKLPPLPRRKPYKFFGYGSLKSSFTKIKKNFYRNLYKKKLLNSFLVDDSFYFTHTFLLFYNNKNDLVNNNSYYFFWLKK